jgi:hypothetical protein
LPPSFPGRFPILPGAGNGIRTRDIQLGKLTLYQLSYARTEDTNKIRSKFCQLVFNEAEKTPSGGLGSLQQKKRDQIEGFRLLISG